MRHPKIKIRRLLQRQPIPEKKFNGRLKYVGISLAIVCLAVILMKNERFRNDLKHLAMNQFQLYLHGRENYCNEPFEHWQISNALHHRIIGQRSALYKINLALQQHESITAMALVGTQGIGKSLTLNIIQKHFQWHLNIQQYVWSLIESPRSQLQNLLKLFDGLTTCGQNGIFVDSVPLTNISIIYEFNQKLLAHAKQKNFKLIVIYVFHTNNVIEANEPVQLENVKSINFRQFNSDDIHNCINMECERLKIALTPQQIDELITDIDATRHGCKSVAARIARQ